MIRSLLASAVLLLLPVSGCATPDLGLAPFICNKGDPQCPDGYVCQNKICVREGYTVEGDASPRLDTSRPGSDGLSPDGPQPIADRPSTKSDHPKTPDQKSPTPDQPQTAAKIVVSEFLADPAASTDDKGEWLELHNTGSQSVDINGWTLKDNGSDVHVISASLVIPGNGYAILGRSTSTSVNGNAPVQYAYGGTFTLANTSDEIILLDKSGKTVDSVAYSTLSGWAIPTGASLSLVKSASSDHNDPINWCNEKSPWSGSAGDKGTPGAPPGC